MMAFTLELQHALQAIGQFCLCGARCMWVGHWPKSGDAQWVHGEWGRKGPQEWSGGYSVLGEAPSSIDLGS